MNKQDENSLINKSANIPAMIKIPDGESTNTPTVQQTSESTTTAQSNDGKGGSSDSHSDSSSSSSKE